MIGDFKTLKEAKQRVLKLNEKNIEAWVLKECECCDLNEEEHALNRKSVFEVTIN